MSGLADQITVIVLTHNEEDNIARTLERLTWAKQVLVVDSGSTDGTLSIVAGYLNAEVVTRPFDSFAGQCNFALSQVKTPYVLSLDADYVLSEALVAEIGRLEEETLVSGYRAGFIYCIFDKPLRGTLYPPRTVLYRRDRARYEDFGHGHAVQIEGAVRDLSGRIFHDDRKPISRWFASQQTYARQEADFLLAAPRGALRFADKVRLGMVLAPILVPLHTLFIKGCILDGRAGWFYGLQRLLAETMIAIALLDRKLRP